MEVSSQAADYSTGLALNFSHKEAAPVGLFVLLCGWQYYERLYG
jgi:hypothetical protein